MATTFTDGAKVASTVQARAGIDITAVYGTYEVGTAAVIDDIFQMVKVPKNGTVLELIAGFDDMDSGAALVIDVGDGGDDDRYILGTTIGQGGGIVRLGSGITGAAAANCMNYTYTDEDTIDVHIDTAPAGSGVGTMKVAVIYTMNS